MTPSEIKSILGRLGGGANKRLGQHFLIDEHVLGVMTATADVHVGDRVVEIGPGLGVLTRALMQQGAQVTAIERDRRFVDYLESEKIGTRIILADATKLDWTKAVDQRPWKFVSNLPYQITSFALRQALWSTQPPIKLVALIQREVAERIVMLNAKTSLLSLMIALASSSVRLVEHVSATAFFPPPKVASAIIEILPLSFVDRRARWGIDPENVMKLAKLGFAHPRKMLAPQLGDATRINNLLVERQLDVRIRAEDLSPEDWVWLAKRLL